MNKPAGLASLACLAWMAACSSTAVSAVPIPSPTSAASTPAPAPPTPSVPQLTLSAAAAAYDCRSGPAVGFRSVDLIVSGQTATITGKNLDGTWWYVKDPKDPTNLCWVPNDQATTSGNLTNLPVVPMPEGVVTAVQVSVIVTFKSCQGPNPVNISGSITDNAAGAVTYHWETGGFAPTDRTIHFTAAGTKLVGTSFEAVSCGSFSAVLRVTAPNTVSAATSFNVGP
jgi:hypothetical protein